MMLIAISFVVSILLFSKIKCGVIYHRMSSWKFTTENALQDLQQRIQTYPNTDKLLLVVIVLLLILDVLIVILLHKLRHSKHPNKSTKLLYFTNGFAATCAIAIILFGVWFYKSSLLTPAKLNIFLSYLAGSILDFVFLILLLPLVAYHQIKFTMRLFVISSIAKIAIFVFVPP